MCGDGRAETDRQLGAAREEVYAYVRKEMMGVFVVNDAEWLGGNSQQVTGDSGLI